MPPKSRERKDRVERYSLILVGVAISAGFLAANSIVGFDADMSTHAAVGAVILFSLFAQTLINAHRDVQAELVKSNQLLEFRVHERTEGLNEINAKLREEIRLRGEAEQLLRASEARYRTIFENAGTAILICDQTGRFLLANSRLFQLCGHSNEDFRENESWINFLDVGQRSKIQRRITEIRTPGALPSSFESTLCRKDGEIRHVHLTVATIHDGEEVLVSLVDITELKKAETRLYHQAFHDHLTGLPNRALFMEILNMALRRSRRSQEKFFSVLYLDIDRFKYINDTMGHLFGDKLLVCFSGTLKHCLRDSDTVARMGGDEFAIVLDDIQGSEYTSMVADRITETLCKPLVVDGHEFVCSVSLGIIKDCRVYENADDILRDADAAMYAAKEAGGSCGKVFEKQMQRRFKRALELELSIRKALENEEFILHYQPIVSMNGGGINSFEALVRWERPGKGLVSPAEFIPVAEETGLILPLGRWVLAKACDQMSRWRQTHPSLAACSISVNLSGRQFKDTDLEEHVKNVLRETGLPPANLKLEITENEMMHNPERAIELLGRFRELGVKIMVDDFGTGYSSLNYLYRLPIDFLKLDKNFVERLDTSPTPGDRKIVETIIALAHSLSLEVVAEGVERAAQRDFLSKLNCQFAQGYLYYRPMPPEMVGEEFLERVGI